MKTAIIIILVLLLAMVVALWLLKTKRMTLPFLYKYEQGYTLALQQCANPLNVQFRNWKTLDKKQFDIHPEPTIMADPFLVKADDRYYIFYEEASAKFRYPYGGNISVLQSADGESWQRLGIALREKFHTSFPNVFQWKGDWYMIPEIDSSGEMRIYRATDFPMHWQLYATPFVGRHYADPMIFVQNDVIYLWFNSYLDGDDLCLYFAYDLCGEWQKHPASPIRKNGDDTRPAGRVAELNGEKVYFVQSHKYGYGTGTICYRIKRLSPTEYEDELLENNPILWRYGDDWAKNGMHHLTFVEKMAAICALPMVCIVRRKCGDSILKTYPNSFFANYEIYCLDI